MNYKYDDDDDDDDDDIGSDGFEPTAQHHLEEVENSKMRELKVLQFRAWCADEDAPPSLASQFASTLAKFRAGKASSK